MKRSALVGMGLLLGAANVANAQLSMQMGNGWALGVSGNVNAFYIYNSTNSLVSGTGSTATYAKSAQQSGIGSGLLPANINFDISGKEGNTNLGAHFGFFPQVSSGGNNASFFGASGAGAQIDMRQVYLTAGGDWGQVLFGKNLGLFQRGNIVNDMTIFGVGPANGGFRGTSLGRIGYGYEYTDFRGQITYSTPASKPAVFSIGIFEPASFGPYAVHTAPRIESELTWAQKSGSNSYGLFISGFLQNSKTSVDTGSVSKTATGVAGGLKLGFSGLNLVGSGFVSKGQGSLFMGNAVLGGNPFPSDGVDADGNLRTTYGWYGQVTFTPAGSKWTLGGSFGGNYNKQTDTDKADPGALGQFKSRQAVIGMISYQVSKSFRLVGEYDNYWTKEFSGDKTEKTNQVAFGSMLFF